MSQREDQERHLDRIPLIIAGTFIGVGMCGFVDGIPLHPILQVHSMHSAKYPRSTIMNIEVNMSWCGLFHALTWTMKAIGLAWLWRCAQRAEVSQFTRTLIGSLVLGWGMFNLVGGLIDHYVLGLQVQHVVEKLGASTWDFGGADRANLRPSRPSPPTCCPHLAGRRQGAIDRTSIRGRSGFEKVSWQVEI